MTYQEKIDQANKAIRGVLRCDVFKETASGRVIKYPAGMSVTLLACFTSYKKTPRQCFSYWIEERGWDVKWKCREKKTSLTIDEEDLCLIVYKD